MEVLLKNESKVSEILQLWKIYKIGPWPIFQARPDDRSGVPGQDNSEEELDSEETKEMASS